MESRSAGNRRESLGSANPNTTASNTATSGSRRPALDVRTSCFEAQTEIGFFWTWNHVLPRKWRGQTTGDEVFQLGMLEDFRAFCLGANSDGSADNRLIDTFCDFKTALSAFTAEEDTPI